MAPIKIHSKKKLNSTEMDTEESMEKSLTSVEGVMKTELHFNVAFIQEQFGHCSDLVIRRLNPHGKIHIAVIHIEGLAGSQQLEDSVIKSMLTWFEKGGGPEEVDNVLAECGNSIMTCGEIAYTDTFDDIFSYILAGEAAILMDGYAQSLIAMTKDPTKRDVSDPKTQSVVRGPQEGFTEDLRTNTTLIRRKIKNVNLRHETKVIGRYTHTDVSMMYLNGVASKDVIEEVHRRLDEIDTDAILESAYIEELIQDSTISPFPTIFNSERPDVVAAGILEGRVAIFVDGTPFVLIVPVIFPQFLQSAEDYYQRTDWGLIRLLRYVAFFLALLSPSLFIAIKTFHQELIPTPLMISLAAQRAGVPFPAFVEAVIMELTFEILREAGIRMPKAVGQAISIVGALVVGQAAVEAGFVTPAMVIVVSVTAISTFVFPAYNLAIAVRGLRFAFMILAATFGLFGVTVGLFLMIIHLCSLRSFGVPYMSPIAPYNQEDQKDTIFHFPLKWSTKNHRLVSSSGLNQQQSDSKE